MEDKELIKKIKNGEINNFVFIVRKYHSKLYQFFSQRLLEREAIDDLIQETLIKFYKNINRFNEEKSIAPYLLAMAQNELKMYWRKNREKTLSLSENIEDESENFLMGKDESLLLSLDKRERKIINFIKQGYRYNEIGKRLKINENTIKTIMRRLRLKIKKIKNEKK